MYFRSEVAEPAVLQRLADAFDAAWIAINADHPIHPLAASAERERLGYLLMHLWQTEPDAALAEVAAERFLDGTAAASPAFDGSNPVPD